MVPKILIYQILITRADIHLWLPMDLLFIYIVYSAFLRLVLAMILLLGMLSLLQSFSLSLPNDKFLGNITSLPSPPPSFLFLFPSPLSLPFSTFPSLHQFPFPPPPPFSIEYSTIVLFVFRKFPYLSSILMRRIRIN